MGLYRGELREIFYRHVSDQEGWYIDEMFVGSQLHSLWCWVHGFIIGFMLDFLSKKTLINWEILYVDWKLKKKCTI
jgi:hypothetical protein